MFFIEGLFMILPAIAVGFQIYVEIINQKRSKKKLSTKSIPFFVFGFMELAILSRIVYGILCFVLNAGDPNDYPVTWSLYIWGVQLYTIQYYFMALCWVKLVVVFYDKNNINFDKEHLVDIYFYILVIVTSLYYIVLVILNYILTNRNITESMWRIYFLVICTFISTIFFFYGSIVIKQLTRSKKELDKMLLGKIKGLLFNMAVMGILCGVLPITYLYQGKGKPAQDWINFVLFLSELFNISTVLIIFGRSEICTRLRVKMAYPEIHNHDHTHSGSSSGSISLSNQSISEGISIQVDPM
ncbi:hypothetical protein DLAC_11758 [Tieghemostelium lacteum]|uniref:THH1/TOM1/TOM3 domain-containing protein n=1 Tax=Tieghemostelium lacteum TaxID=361077 RepID=A0A151Z959_TIELA|nr:hypothetical protein DLAC_11758 [Tieghemostelium lacteum]|eukprot:KYQ90489.1 hypothetical protein DLAC_11758 [Tieghemostelium lacteum]